MSKALYANLDGVAYGRPPAHPNHLLTKVGPGQPCGEYMRRFWQPVLTSEHVTTRPREIRILGEDLLIFRDGSGRPGLLYPRCMHRGTTLLYGHVEPDGIRCCYHGWKFAVDGTCIDQPCEPGGGQHKEAARQPWYPVQEKYGLVWAYMGPAEKRPVLPRWDVLENLRDDEHYQCVDNSWGAHRDPDGPEVVPYSWLHMNDNIMDPFHVQVLHSTFSAYQFVREFEIMPTCEFEYIDAGVIYKAYRDLEDGREVDRISTWLAPNIMSVPSTMLAAGPSTGMGFVVPVDDTHSRIVGVARMPKGQARVPYRVKGKTWSQMSLEDRQDEPNDYEAQSGQGPVSLHSEEHLATSDRGIAMQRRALEQNIKKVMEGGDPDGVILDPANELVHVPSGNFFRQTKKVPEPA
jgi:phenylpropionate dioxygenase-like ring-hydroxylating dioxygenase large terminal subunit